MITTVPLVLFESVYSGLELSPPREQLTLILLIRQGILSGFLQPYDESISV